MERQVRVTTGIPDDWPDTGQIVEVLDETVVVELDNGRRTEVPTDQVTIPDLSPEDLGELLGPDAAAWPGLGLRVTLGGYGEPLTPTSEHVQVWRDLELIGYTEPLPESPERRVYRAVISIPEGGAQFGVPFPAGFLPPDPIRAARDERVRFTGRPDEGATV
ncbi:hypothetical protein [Streptomyces chryseus]|uniref:hypothetical protein n=1 Tax=Streptomyces chryseus TaxID=68186 RepID=UPI00110FD936|nr:hypothetical protein [Streptomyces chryseus]GGX36523.1 hypothetical protein GCM10010353_59520 [Streptomyces chryseus]